MAEQIAGRSRELLEQPNFCFVTTLRRDGTPHVALVWVDIDGEQILLNSARGRQWPTNLERDARITLTVPNRENPYEYVSIRGRLAEERSEGARHHIDALAKKYLDQDVYPFHQPGEERIILRVEPEHVSYRGA